ncbi:zinc finger, CCHC-type containing protein [Tanacetum coccineum]
MKILLYYYLLLYPHNTTLLFYGQEALNLEDVMATLNLKEIKERSKAKGDDGERLYVRGKTDRKDLRQSWGKSRSKSRGSVKKYEQPSSSGLTYDDSEVVMVMSVQALLDWIMDSKCSYHMTPRNLISLGTIEKEGFTLKLQSGKVKVVNGFRVVLSGIRRDNCVYSLDGHAMAGELNASVKEKDSLAQVWHKRLGHISEAGLHVLEKQGLFGKKSLGGYGFISSVCIAQELLGRSDMYGQISYNRSPSRAIEKKTPMKMWSGHPSDYGMLRIFSCVAYSHDKQGVMYKDTLKDSGVGADKSVEELHVEVELERLNNYKPEEDHTDQEDGDDEDVGYQETDQTPVLIDYELA